MSQYHNGITDEESHTKEESNSYSNSHSYDIYNYSNVFFATEKINMPRDKVVNIESANSSPSHGFRRHAKGPGSISPKRVGKEYLEQIVGSS
jgi:hypothetical protein